MAAETGLSQSSVSRIWRAFGLKPHLVETWKLSTDPEFIAKVPDVVGLYMSSPEHALVLAVEEKSQIQPLDRTAPCLPILPTTPERRPHDYVRDGTTSLFAAYDVMRWSTQNERASLLWSLFSTGDSRVMDGSNVAGVVQKTVADGDLPALVVIHDDEDDWVINDGVNDPNIPGACDICHLGHVAALDPTVAEVMDIPAGYVAFRQDGSSPWVIELWEYPDDE